MRSDIIQINSNEGSKDNKTQSEIRVSLDACKSDEATRLKKLKAWRLSYPIIKTESVRKKRMIFNMYCSHHRGDRDIFPPPEINSPVAV